MGDKRELVMKFLDLPFHTKLAIVRKLGLTEKGPEGEIEPDACVRWMKEANARGLIPQVFEETERAYYDLFERP